MAAVDRQCDIMQGGCMDEDDIDGHQIRLPLGEIDLCEAKMVFWGILINQFRAHIRAVLD